MPPASLRDGGSRRALQAIERLARAAASNDRCSRGAGSASC